jgi:glucose/arabinose dehydrogenase
MGKMMSKAGAGGKSANRISLLRDADGDGKAEVKTAYITGLNSPYGIALVGKTLYVANTDALLAFPYVEGETAMSGKPTKIVDLPAKGTNRHWTKSLAAAPNGWLYIGVGADSNIGEKGMNQEVRRATVLEVRPENGYVRTFAAGIRNPVGLAFYPGSDQLWTVVNERDMLGSDLVPDYLAEVDEGDFYGWPWYYWGGFVDSRVAPDAEDRRQYVKRPEYALGAHTAPLGMTFTTGLDLGDRFANGALIARHGSWNREPVAGYDVVFVKFGANGKPIDALPITLLDQFLSKDAKTTRGRPADVKVAKDGSALIADDTGGVIWRVSKAG